MAEFKAIETQEQLDAIIKDRLARKEESVRSEYSDYDSLKEAAASIDGIKADYESKLAEALSGGSEKDGRISALEAELSQLKEAEARRKIAEEFGIPAAFAGRITGSNEDEMRKDAESIASVFKASRPNAPLRNPEAGTTDGVTAAFKKLNPTIKI